MYDLLKCVGTMRRTWCLCVFRLEEHVLVGFALCTKDSVESKGVKRDEKNRAHSCELHHVVSVKRGV